VTSSEVVVSADVALAIHGLLADYASAADSLDPADLRAVFTVDARLTMGEKTYEGADACTDFLRGSVGPEVLSQHSVSNLRIRREGDGYRVDSVLRALVFLPDATRLVVGRYSDSVDVLDGVARIRHKRITVQRHVVLPEVAPAPALPRQATS
jgi:hypothetical protein